MRPLAGSVTLHVALAFALATGMSTEVGAQRTRAVRAVQQPAAATDELSALRAAMARERAGDMDGAATALRAILEHNAQSLSALISLERILAMQGRTEELLPYIDRLIEADEESPIGNQMRVRANSMLDRIADVERAGEAWIAATPDVETPYREIARIWRQRGDYERALAVLERGRERVHRDDALALELGDLYADIGQPERAVLEWERAIADDGQGFLLVQRRLAQMPDGGAAVVYELIASLMSEPSSIARRRAAAQVAIDAGLGVEAARITREVAASLDDDARREYLVEVARRADGAGLVPVAYWAYGELVRAQQPEEQMLALRTRLAELALALGDTARAVHEYDAIEDALAPGSPQRRQALAISIDLAARAGALDDGLRQLDAFRAEYPAAPELDGIIGALGGALLDAGRIEEAERLAANARGPQAGMIRGRAMLLRGDVARARTELLNAAPALSGAEATETIALATLLGRLSPRGGGMVASALARLADGERGQAVEMLLHESAALPDAEHAALLDFAATTAVRAGLPEFAEQARRSIVETLPRTQEAPAALLDLAHTLAQRRDDIAEARVLVERLILEYPRSALVPQARHMLDRISGRVPRS
ncbi:MAG: tetratricopeptide repeat protein [Longimicrobiales bacterium]